MKKALKQQIKQDELATGYQHAGEWLQAHAERLKTVGAGVVVLALVLGGFLYFRQQRVAESQRAFNEALTHFDARVGTAETGAAFTTNEEKYKKALTGFEGVVSRFGGLAVGGRARYYAALCRLELGEQAQAESALNAMATGSRVGSLDAALAELALARIDRVKGAHDQAINRYQKVLAFEETGLPRDYVLVSLAAAFEEAGRLGEARSTLQRVSEQMPDSLYAGEARARAEYIRLAAAR